MSEEQVLQLRFNAGRYEEGIIRVIRTVQALFLLFFIAIALEMIFTTSRTLGSILLRPLPVLDAGIGGPPLQVGLYVIGIFSPLLLIYTLDFLIEYP
jgi:hypothetical protein